MFDIGFWELIVIGVVALLVIGPERLPAVARTAGLWVGRARRFVSSVQSDISREMNKSEELQRLLQEQSQIKEMHEIIEQTVDETRKTVAIGKGQQQDDDQTGTKVHEDVDSGLHAHAPRSLDDDAAAGISSPPDTATQDAAADKQVPASATDAMNDPAK